MTSRGSAVLLLGVLAAIAVGTWLVVSGAGSRTPLQAAGPHTPRTGGTAGDDAMEPIGRGEPRAGAGRDQVIPVEIGPAPSTITLDPALSPPPADAIEILVRVRETKEPVPGAVVLAADWSSLSEEEQYALWWSDTGPLDGLERLGQRFQSDASGVVRVPRPTEGGMATCEHHGLFAQLDLDSDPSAKRTLDLVPDRSIVARVLDVDGTPVADAQVGLRVRTQWWSWDVAKARTGADGLATLEHAQMFFLQEFDPGQRFAVGLVLHALEPIEVEIDPAALPSGPIELRLPPHGSVEVILDPPAGGTELPAGVATVYLQDQHDDEDGGVRYQTWSPRLIEDGRALFATVGLGLDFLAQAQSTAFEVPAQEFAGPRAAGERVVVHLSAGSPKPRVEGRALLEDGAPLADARVRGTIRFLGPENDWTTGFAAKTDAEGGFSASIGEVEDTGSAGGLELEFEDLARGKLVGRVPLSGRLLPGENDVGDVRLSPPPLLVSGRVVDPAGNGIRGARVSLEGTEQTREVVLHAGATSFFHWGGLLAISASDGSFEVRGEMAGDLYQLTASHADYRGSEQREVQRGAHVVLTLTAAGRIAGRVEAGEGIPVGNVQMVPLDLAGNELGVEERRESDGRFELVGLEPGSYTISARLGEEEAELARVDGILVEAGKTTEDPRLDPLDLSGKLARIVLRVRDRDGNAPGELTVARRPPGRESYLDPSWWGGIDEIVLVTAERALDLRIEADGARTAEIFGATGEVDVTLGAGLPIELDLSGIQRAIGARHRLYAEIVHLPAGRGRMDRQGQGDERGIVACSVGEPGEWGVRVHLVQNGNMDEWVSTQLGQDLLSTIQVQDSTATQTFVIEAAPEVIAAALSELGG